MRVPYSKLLGIHRVLRSFRSTVEMGSFGYGERKMDSGHPHTIAQNWTRSNATEDQGNNNTGGPWSVITSSHAKWQRGHRSSFHCIAKSHVASPDDLTSTSTSS